MYYYLMVSNLLLRLSWTYKLSPHLRHNFDTVLLFTLLEVRPALRNYIFQCHRMLLVSNRPRLVDDLYIEQLFASVPSSAFPRRMLYNPLMLLGIGALSSRAAVSCGSPGRVLAVLVALRIDAAWLSLANAKVMLTRLCRAAPGLQALPVDAGAHGGGADP